MFWCITCDGYSSRGMRILVVGCTDNAASTALQLTRFTSHVSLLTNNRDCYISDDELRYLKQASIPVIYDKIAWVEGEDGYFRNVNTEGGECIELDVLFNQQGAMPNVKLALDPVWTSTATAISRWIAIRGRTSACVCGGRCRWQPFAPGQHGSPRGRASSVGGELFPVSADAKED
jgi:alkyl hydroperoxide reductase subunit AhpF